MHRALDRPALAFAGAFFFHNTLPMDHTEQLNEDIAGWGKNTLSALQNELDRQGVEHRKYSRSSRPLKAVLQSKTAKRFGLVNRVGFTMPRHAVFLPKGVSRGHPKTNPRKKKDWFNPVIDQELPKLADKVAEAQGNLIVSNLHIR